MTGAELDRYANGIAGMTLKDGFNEQAYIVKILSELSLKLSGESVDLVPESQIDETIQSLMNDFVVYFNTHDTGALTNFLHKMHNILSELYHGTETQEERRIISDEIKSISLIN